MQGKWCLGNEKPLPTVSYANRPLPAAGGEGKPKPIDTKIIENEIGIPWIEFIFANPENVENKKTPSIRDAEKIKWDAFTFLLGSTLAITKKIVICNIDPRIKHGIFAAEKLSKENKQRFILYSGEAGFITINELAQKQREKGSKNGYMRAFFNDDGEIVAYVDAAKGTNIAGLINEGWTLEELEEYFWFASEKIKNDTTTASLELCDYILEESPLPICALEIISDIQEGEQLLISQGSTEDPFKFWRNLNTAPLLFSRERGMPHYQKDYGGPVFLKIFRNNSEEPATIFLTGKKIHGILRTITESKSEIHPLSAKLPNGNVIKIATNSQDLKNTLERARRVGAIIAPLLHTYKQGENNTWCRVTPPPRSTPITGIELRGAAMEGKASNLEWLLSEAKRRGELAAIINEAGAGTANVAPTKRTALHRACFATITDPDAREKVDLLLEYGANISLQDKDGKLAMDLIDKSVVSPELLQRLDPALSTSAPLPRTTPVTGKELREKAATPELKKLLEKAETQGVLPTIINEASAGSKLTALHCACAANAVDNIKLLLDQKTDVSLPDKNGKLAIDLVNKSVLSSDLLQRLDPCPPATLSSSGPIRPQAT